MTTTPYWIAGRLATGTDGLEVRSPFDGALAGRTTNATAADVAAAVSAAAAARAVCAPTPAHVRAEAPAHWPGGTRCRRR